MAGPTTTIGDDRTGDFHNRLPVRVRHIGDQDLAFLELTNVLCLFNDVDLSLAYLTADCFTFDK